MSNFTEFLITCEYPISFERREINGLPQDMENEGFSIWAYPSLESVIEAIFTFKILYRI